MRMRRRTVLRGATAVAGATAMARFAGGGLGTLEVAAADTAPVPAVDEWVPTTCWIGKQDCGLLARRVNGRLVKLEGHPDHPRNRGRLCPKGVAQIQAIYDPNRVKTPLRRTNAKGVSGAWTPISWDEALDLTATRINEARQRGSGRFIWQKGRSKAKSFYDKAFVKASGATKLHHGAFCSDAAYRASEYTIGFHGGFHPDFKYTDYLLSWGWGMTAGGGNKFCQITWHQEFLEARARGMQTVHIDPFRRNAAQFADTWLPIRPGTDLAFFLALAHELLRTGHIDRPYLTQHTNAASLVGDDGLLLRSDNAEEPKELVWDEATGTPVEFDAEGIQPALEGRFRVSDRTVKTAFETLKDHLADASPEWAASITGLEAADIRAVAQTLGRRAQIGSTRVIDGVEVPYRPVALMGYHVAQQELGFQASRALLLPFMLVGAIESVGGLRSDTSRKLHKNWGALDAIEIGEGPYNVYLKNSKFYPINSNNSSVAAHVMLDPERFELETMPEAMLIHMANPMASFLDQPALREAYAKLKFVAVIDPWLSETADLFADVVLPAATIEKYEGPLSVGTQYVDAKSLRVPPIEPLFDSKGDIDIYLDLTERMGVLTGEKGYVDHINSELKLKDEFALDVDAKPVTRDIFDRWARQNGYAGGVTFFETQGVSTTKPIPAAKYYAAAWDPPYGGARHRLYGESLLRYQRRMQELGADRVFWQDYTPLPTWRAPTMEASPPEYDLHLISYKKIEFKQARSTFIPILNELAGRQGLVMHPRAAAARGLTAGDHVVVESQNALTGETRTVTTSLTLLESIRPDTVAMSAHFGMWTHPWTKESGPTPNVLFFSGPGYVSNTADQSYHVKVRVSRAEG